MIGVKCEHRVYIPLTNHEQLECKLRQLPDAGFF